MSETREIPLTQGKQAVVDAADFDWLNRYKWCASFDSRHNWYAVRSVWEKGKSRSIRMHRELLGATGKTHVDHRDGDGLNNTRSNLRLATCQQNLCNTGARRSNTSGYKGVVRHGNKWAAQITLSGKFIWLGTFAKPEEASAAYIAAAAKYHGEFARTT